MEDQIIKYLQKKYNAKAIILHGSRARGNPHKHSDWDLLVFTDKIIKEAGGAKLGKEDLDIKVIQLPVTDVEKFISEWPQSCQTTKVLLDTDEKLGSRIHKSAEKKFAKKQGISKQRAEYIRSHFDRMLTRLVDFENDPEVFFYHLASFYLKTVRYWFEYQSRWSQPIREALTIIEKEDQTFAKAVKTITDNSKTNKEKIVAAEIMTNAVLSKEVSETSHIPKA